MLCIRNLIVTTKRIVKLILNYPQRYNLPRFFSKKKSIHTILALFLPTRVKCLCAL